MNCKNKKCDCTEIHGDIIRCVSSLMPSKNDFDKLTNLYKAFADKTRAKILWALKCEKMCVCDLAVLLDMTKSAISHQLKTLLIANLVRNEKRGKNVYYSLADNHVENIFKSGFEHIKH